MSSDAVVHIIDDDTAVRQSLSFLLASEGIPVRLHESADAFFDLIASCPHGCIVTDVRMPGMSGIELLRHLKKSDLSIPVIVMTGHADVPLAVEAMKQGAVDFIEKPFDDEYFVNAVQAALARDRTRFRQNRDGESFRSRLRALSKRETQVLERLIDGKANKIIAHELSLSPRTVEIYRAKVMTKMQAGSLPELVRMVMSARN